MPTHFFAPNHHFTEKSSAAAERLTELGNKIFWEFNRFKSAPSPLPQTYQMNRLTQPPIYERMIKDSPELQQHLAKKIIQLIESTKKTFLNSNHNQVINLTQDGDDIQVQTNNLLRQIEIDQSRPKGFELVSVHQVRSLIEQTLEWNNLVLTWYESTKEAEINTKKAIPTRMTDSQKIDALKRTQAADLPVTSNENWTSSVSDAAKKLILAVKQHEYDQQRGASPK